MRRCDNELGDGESLRSFDFGPKLPALEYSYNDKQFGQLHARRKELKKHFGSYDIVNILLWLGFGIDDKEFEYLCAYFVERELGHKTDVRGGYLDGGIDVSGVKGTKEHHEYIAMQCKQWNAWYINGTGILEMYRKMAHAQEKYDARLFIATINYLTDEVWSFLEDKMEVWDYRTILDYYDKYFFDPEAGWEEFENFMKRKEVYALELKQQMEFEELETRINKRKFTIERPSISQRDELNFEILREVRKVEAKRWEIYPNYVFSDAVLYEMVKRRPKTRLEFLRIPGVGEEKYKKHCGAFAEAIKHFD